MLMDRMKCILLLPFILSKWALFALLVVLIWELWLSAPV